MRFFFDRCISEHLAKMLDGFDRDNQITHQDWDSRFEVNSTDTDLLGTVGSDDVATVWVSADLNQIKKYPEERRALVGCGMSAVFLRSGFHDLGHHNQARLLINVWPSVVLSCETCKHPTVFEVGARVNTLKVERVCMTKELDGLKAGKTRGTKRSR